MKTQILTADDVCLAAEILQEGGLVAIPTETVYGLAADATNSAAVRKIFAAKGRPCDNPLIVHISQLDEVQGLVKEFTLAARRLTEAFWPGPLTIILPKSPVVPDVVSGGLSSVAVRMPNHDVAREIIRLAGCPLAAPSANISGSPSPTCAEHVIADLDGRIDAIVDAGPCCVGVESSVVSLCDEKPRLLRPGAISLEQLQDALGEDVEVDPAITTRLSSQMRPTSPGMKYRHYAPQVRVVAVLGDSRNFIGFVNGLCSDNVAALCYDGDVEHLNVPAVPYGAANRPDLQAQGLFAALRKLDTLDNVDTVYARCPEPCGVGLAVYNRLIRAANFEVIRL